MKKLLFIFVLVLLIPLGAAAQGTGFSFQGRLNDGTNPANGSYDLQFRLYDAIAGGTQIGALAARPNTTLINGVFSVTLDFGAAAFNNPNSIFIEIAVKPNGSPNAYTILGPRQQLTVVPFAVRAASATTANSLSSACVGCVTNPQIDSVDGTKVTGRVDLATSALSAADSLRLGGLTPSNYARLDFVNTGDIKTTGGLLIDGNARQFTASNGLVKASALVRVTRLCSFSNCTTLTPTFVNCYNSVTNSTSSNCGFSFPNVFFDGVQVNFGFEVQNRFISLTSGVGATAASVSGFPNNTTVSVLNGLNTTSEFYIYIF